MNTETGPFERDLGASLDELARTAPAAPDAARVLASLRRRSTVRAGMAAAAGVVLVLGAVALVPHRDVQPIPPQQIAKTPEAPAMTPLRRFHQPSPLVMPTMSFMAVPLPGPGTQGRFGADLAALSMPAAVAEKGPSTSMGLMVPSVSMPNF